jgi:hypothetical protein
MCRARARGIVGDGVERLITIAVLGLAIATVLVKESGPNLVRFYRASQVAAASPMP